MKYDYTYQTGSLFLNMRPIVYSTYHAGAAAACHKICKFLKEFYSLKDWIKLDNLFQLYEVHRHIASANLPYLLAEYN
jgi:hypothetical protein